MGKIHLKHGAAWKEPTKLYVKRSGAWVEPTGGYIKAAGVWERFYPGIDPALKLDLDFTITTALDPRITFSRASLGTYYGSDGLLKYAGHNFFQQSQDFDTTWGKAASSTVTVNATTAPDATTTADKINHTVAGTVTGGGVSQTAGSAIGMMVLSVYAKAGTKNFLIIAQSATAHINNHASFNLATGTVGNLGSQPYR